MADVVHTTKPMADVYLRANGTIELRAPRAMAPLARHLRVAVPCPSWARAALRDDERNNLDPYHEEVWELVAPASATHNVQVFREVKW